MAQNKNLIYVALGLGAGVFAYYYFCRRKYTLNGNGEYVLQDGEVADEKPIGNNSNPTGRELAPPPISKPITFIKELVAPTTSSTGTTATSTTPISTPISTSVSTPISTPISTSVSTSVDKPVATSVTTPVDKPIATSVTTPVDKPALTKEVLTKEIEILPTRTISDVKTSEPVKVGFDGVGQMCFEVGDCLYDL